MSVSYPVVTDKPKAKYEGVRYHSLHELRTVRAKERIHGKSFKHEEKKEQCAMRAARKEYYK